MSRSRLDCHSHGCDYSSSQHIKVSDPCRSVNTLLTPNLCFDSTSPSVVKKHHSLLRGCKAQFLSIRQASLKFNHKGKVSDCQNQISSYFSIMHYLDHDMHRIFSDQFSQCFSPCVWKWCVIILFFLYRIWYHICFRN